MRKYTRELLVTSKIADTWRNNLEQKIEELIDVVWHVHDEDQVHKAVELLDVYPKRSKKNNKTANRKLKSNRPFQFVVCRN